MDSQIKVIDSMYPTKICTVSHDKYTIIMITHGPYKGYMNISKLIDKNIVELKSDEFNQIIKDIKYDCNDIIIYVVHENKYCGLFCHFGAMSNVVARTGLDYDNIKIIYDKFQNHFELNASQKCIRDLKEKRAIDQKELSTLRESVKRLLNEINYQREAANFNCILIFVMMAITFLIFHRNLYD